MHAWTTVRSVAALALILLPVVGEAHVAPETALASTVAADGPTGLPTSFAAWSLCEQRDGDYDGAQRYTFCRLVHELHAHGLCLDAGPNCTLTTEPDGATAPVAVGDPADGEHAAPANWQLLCEVAPCWLDLGFLPGLVNDALRLIGDLTRNVPRVGQEFPVPGVGSIVQDALEAVNGVLQQADDHVGGLFPLTVPVPAVQGPYDADGDGVPLLYVGTCPVSFYADAASAAADCGGWIAVGDPDDSDPRNPIDTPGTLGQVQSVVDLLTEAVLALADEVQATADQLVQAIVGALLGLFPVSVPVYEWALFDADADFVPVVRVHEDRLVLDADGSIHQEGGPEVLVAGDPDDGDRDAPVPWSTLEQVPPQLVDLLVWVLNEALGLVEGTPHVDGSELVGDLQGLVSQALGTVTDAAQDQFPVSVVLPQVEGPVDADADGVWTMTVRFCDYDVQSNGDLDPQGCDASQDVGDPDDANPKDPIDASVPGQVVADVLDLIAATVFTLAEEAQAIVDEATQAIDQAVDGVFPITVTLYDWRVENADGDAVPRVVLTERRLTVDRDGRSVYAQGDEAGAVGDPDDADPANPFPSLEPLVTDWDGDGHANSAEASLGSHPLRAESTPDTDDDGDGYANRQEAGVGNERATQSGAWGVVAHWDPGYPQVGAGNALVVMVMGVGPTARVYVWDSYCEPALVAGDYASCRATTERGIPSAKYNGDYRSDGWGWRYQGQPGLIFPITIPAIQPCAGTPRDADGDNVPFVRMCRRDYAVYPDGHVEPYPGETPVGPPIGDPDDADPTTPVPPLPVDGLVHEVLEAVGDAVADAEDALDAVPEAVEQLVAGLEELAAGTVEDAEAQRDELLALIADLQGELGEAAADVSERAASIAAALDCLTTASVGAIERLTGRIEAYAATRNEPNLELLGQELLHGPAALASAFDACAAGSALGELAEAVFDAFFGLAGTFLESVAHLLPATGDAVGVVAEYLGLAGDLAEEVLWDALGQASAFVRLLADTLAALPFLVEDTLDEFSSHPWTETVHQVFQAVFGDGDAGPRAYLEFVVTGPDEAALGGATVTLERDGRVVATGTTDADGRLGLGVAPDAWHDYAVNATGHAPAEGRVLAPAATRTQEVHVGLEAADETVPWPPWAAWALVGAVALLVLAIRRRRR
jgi:hypothetical protein